MIETPRLRLRRFRPADAAPYAAIRARPAVMRFMPGGEARCATAATDAARLVAEWAESGPWAVEDRATGALLGHAGLRDLGAEWEVLYLLDEAAWGRGLATEAACAARDHGFGVLGLPALVGYCLPGNAASRRVLEKLGMRAEGTRHVFGVDALRFALAAPAVTPPPAPPPG